MVVGRFRILKFAAGMWRCRASILAESRWVDLVVSSLPKYLKMLGDCIADRKVAVCQLLTFSVRRRKFGNGFCNGCNGCKIYKEEGFLREVFEIDIYSIGHGRA